MWDLFWGRLQLSACYARSSASFNLVMGYHFSKAYRFQRLNKEADNFEEAFLV